jgi:hypothetical protein
MQNASDHPLDTGSQISLFVKLKFENCARPGNRAGRFDSRLSVHGGAVERQRDLGPKAGAHKGRPLRSISS